MIRNNFIKRHNGPTASDAEKMLKVIGVASQEQLVDEIIAPEIRLPKDLNIGEGMSEYEVISHLKALGAKNKQFRSYIGLGYYNTITPGVIMRNILENPGWYRPSSATSPPCRWPTPACSTKAPPPPRPC